MKAPAFWDSRSALMGKLLTPLGWAYAGATAWRLAHGSGWRAPVPVICVGNLTAGGVGKTPIVRDLALRLKVQGRNPGIISRGYGGRERGPLEVDPARHSAAQVGDEPLLLARDAACWIAENRADGARAMVASAIDVIVMDDGLQNTSLIQDLKLVVVDGESGFGNGRAIPAGPLRERIGAGIARADALIIVGDDKHHLVRAYSSRIQILRAYIDIENLPIGLHRLVAFAGIGRPQKFKASLAAKGADIAAFHEFGDHHPYSETELANLARQAGTLDATLVTTEKDWVRLTPQWQNRIEAIPARVTWTDEDAPNALIGGLGRHG